jgi:hypothetical protein
MFGIMLPAPEEGKETAEHAAAVGGEWLRAGVSGMQARHLTRIYMTFVGSRWQQRDTS